MMMISLIFNKSSKSMKVLVHFWL